MEVGGGGAITREWRIEKLDENVVVTLKQNTVYYNE